MSSHPWNLYVIRSWKQGEEKTQKTSGAVKAANEQQNENTVQSEQTNDPQTEEQQDPMPQQGEGL